MSNTAGKVDKVFGIGTYRTGNTSLEYALRALGLNVMPDRYGWDRLRDYWQGVHICVDALAAAYQAFTGPPWNQGDYYRRLADKYPKAKFILTRRPSKDWVASVRRFASNQRAFLSEITGGQPGAIWSREFGISRLEAASDAVLAAAYTGRNDSIAAHFSGTNRLLIIDWEAFRWGPLCDFLGVPHIPPDTSVPWMRRWEQQDGKSRYMANPAHSYGRDREEFLPTIHFTASCWNRWKHLQALLDNLRLIYNVDPNIALHVGFFRSDDVSVDEARTAVESLPFPGDFILLEGSFNNGRAHNAGARKVEADDIVCPICIDLRMPVDITTRIRAATSPGKSFYGPFVQNEDESGKLHRCLAAYSLVSMFASDYQTIGGFAENVHWGGDHDPKPEGGEDIVMCRALRKAGLHEVRPFERDLVCRWHPRDITQEFYTTLRRYRRKPWWTLVDAQGKPVSF